MKIKKILLVSPTNILNIQDQEYEYKRCSIPLGLTYLAAVTLKEGYEVKILDAVVEDFNNEIEINPQFIRYGLSYQNIKERINNFSPDLVGISCLFSKRANDAHLICKAVKEINNNILTVMGGAYPSSNVKIPLKDKNLDFILAGEAEESFVKLLNNLNLNNNLEGIERLAFRKNNGEIFYNNSANFITNLDSLPFPALHLLPIEKYFEINNDRRLEVVTSRGCPFKCTFCSISSVWGRKYRVRSPENVLEELKELKSKYKIDTIFFEDDNLTLNEERAIEIFNLMIENNLNLKWLPRNGLAIHTLKDNVIELMVKSGCIRAVIAVESGDQSVLDNIIKKNLKLEQVKRVVKEFKKYNIPIEAFFVVGFPRETLKQIKRTFEFAHSLKVNALYIFPAMPLPATELYEECVKEKIINENLDLKCFSGMSDLINTEHFKGEELKKMIKRELAKHRQNFTQNSLKERFKKNPVKFIIKQVIAFLKNPYKKIKVFFKILLPI